MARPRTRTAPTPARSTRAPVASVECQVCGHQNVAEAKFCNSCGARVDFVACRACDAINARDTDLCYRCGASLSRRGGRSNGAAAALTHRAASASAPERQPSAADPVPSTPAASDAVSAPGQTTLDIADAPRPVEEITPAATPAAVTAVAEEQLPQPTVAHTSVDAAMARSAAPRASPGTVGLWLLVGTAAIAAGLAAFYPDPGVKTNPTTLRSVPAAPAAVAAPAIQTQAPPVGPSEAEAPPKTASESAGARDSAALESPPPDASADVHAPPVATQPTARKSAPPANRSAKRQPVKAAAARESAAVEEPSSSATLREQISAGSTRRVTCTQSALALGLCTASGAP